MRSRSACVSRAERACACARPANRRRGRRAGRVASTADAGDAAAARVLELGRQRGGRGLAAAGRAARRASAIRTRRSHESSVARHARARATCARVRPTLRVGLEQQGRARPGGGPGVAGVVEVVVDPRQRAVRAGERVDPAELPVAAVVRGGLEADVRPAAGEAEQMRKIRIRAVLPAGAPDALEGGHEFLQRVRGGPREQVRDAVNQRWHQRSRLRPGGAEERQHAVDVDQQQRSSGPPPLGEFGAPS